MYFSLFVSKKFKVRIPVPERSKYINKYKKKQFKIEKKEKKLI